MRISVHCFLTKPKKGSKYWAIEIPALGIHTQGASRRDSYVMARDAIRVLFDVHKLNVEISDDTEAGFLATFPADKEIFAKFLRASRITHDLTIMEMARRLKSKSPTAYARYESGRVMPSMDKFSEILEAMDKKLTPKLVVGG